MTKSQIVSGHYFANIHLKKLGLDPSIQVSFPDQYYEAIHHKSF